MPIRILSDQLASQIAAGEVVERPSSVVKELLENSLDAGASTINVDIREAGRKSIQIADDGSGIPAAEIETAFRRHATSKLTDAAGLNAIATLGFRGEALAAIAAVSQVTVVSRAAGEAAGTRLTLEGGKVTASDTVGAPQGTVIAVDNLFFNMPARLKFLKSNSTEKRLIDELVTRYALAYPQVRFRLTHNGRITFQTSGGGSVRDVLLAIYGPEIARQLLEIAEEQRGGGAEEKSSSPPQVTGFVGPPGVHWSNRSHVVLFVNGRWVKDNSLTYAVIQAYDNLLPAGRYPLGIIFLTLPPDQVDVNVHPAKTEVRFRLGKPPFSAVQKAVRQTLLAAAPAGAGSWTSGGYAQPDSPGWTGSLDHNAFAPAAQSQMALGWETADFDEEIGLPPQEGDAGENQLPIMRVVGQVGAAYIVSEGPEGVFLIDQQAAHARVLFEQLGAARQRGDIPAKPLAAGTAVTLSPTQAELLAARLETLARLGFQVEPFGPQAFMIRAIPDVLAQHDPAQALVSILTALEQERETPADAETFLLKRVCQVAAYRPGQTLTPPQMAQLLRRLEQCRDPFTGPNGNPTFIYLSVAQLAREFGRI